MSEGLCDAMTEQMAVICTNIATLNMAADQLGRSASLCEGKPLSDRLRDTARRQRVKVLELQGQLAVLNVSFEERFGLELWQRATGP